MCNTVTFLLLLPTHIQVAKLYAPSAVLLPTVSNKVRTSRASIEDYFRFFLMRKPQGVIDESYVKVLSPELATHNGIYTFTLCNGDGTSQKVSARFSFTYRKTGDTWEILEHHSSALPESTASLPCEKEIRGMFDKWNAALATRDAVKVCMLCCRAHLPLIPLIPLIAPEQLASLTGCLTDCRTHLLPPPLQVADLYGQGAVLLPTVSNEVSCGWSATGGQLRVVSSVLSAPAFITGLQQLGSAAQ